jgi:methylated-DNA-[protein]-cysteine S-methyltransferase
MGDRARADAKAAESSGISARAVKTPVGVIYIVATNDRVLAIELPGAQSARPVERWLRHRTGTPAIRAAAQELRDYFAGRRRRFTVPVDPAGTEFQQRVWRSIAAIPFGETVSYAEIATDLGGPEKARAVGAAVGANPIPIIIPCHRVIGSDGSLTGYSGGLRMKVWLLHHEGVLLA